MRSEGITLHLKKCRFAQHTVKFCGEIIGYGIRRPNSEKVAAIRDMYRHGRTGNEKKQLRGILGFF